MTIKGPFPATCCATPGLMRSLEGSYTKRKGRRNCTSPSLFHFSALRFSPWLRSELQSQRKLHLACGILCGDDLTSAV